MLGKLKFFGALVLIISAVSGATVPVTADTNLSGWHKGILVQSTYNTDYSSGNFQQSMRNAAADGVNYVNLVVTLRQSNIYSNDVYAPNEVPTDQSLADGIRFVHSLGMQASVNLHVDPNDGQWRAMISPSDRGGWFANYGRLLNHYADVAQANNAEELSIGTEMSSLTLPSYSGANTPGWQGMIQSVRGHFHGLLTYGAQHGGYMSDDTQLGFWSSLDEIGISAYYSMGDRNASVNDMQNTWSNIDNNELKGLANSYGKPIIFGEIGYVSGDNGLGDPGAAYSNPGGTNLDLQARAYKAALMYWSNSSYMKGLSFWDWSTNPNAGGNGDNSYTPQNKPAEQVMKQWFTGGGTSGGGMGGGGTTAPAAGCSLTSNSATALTTNSGTTSTVNVSCPQSVSNAIVDVEIYDAGGKQIAQKYYENQTVSNNAATYQINWTPPKDGQYTLKAGIFTANWQSNIIWNGSIATLTASTKTTTTTPPTTTPTQPSQPPATTPTSGNISIWWPGSGTNVSGVQPFKAVLDGVDVNGYKLYWQVDGGTLNAMRVDNTGAPHQEADVDLSGWNWHGNGGAYVINFVAKDNSGNTIAQKSTTINIYH